VRILVDYRPALRERSGVGEYVHELFRAYTALPDAHDDQVTLFSSSWKDRPAPGLGSELRARVVDRRVPVRVLNFAWHRLERPAVEWLAGPADVVHAPHPLLIPTRGAAQVITIHDLFFITHPERTHAEIRRDYALLAPQHARRADAVVTISRHSAARISHELGVDPARLHICPPGAPSWRVLGGKPNLPAAGYVLFLGTLEPRKNIGVLLDAFERLVSRTRAAPPKLVLAGRTTPQASSWLERLQRAPLAGFVEHRGYIPATDRERLFAGARLLVMPSLDEGFGMPVLEAMAAGVPVVASNRGSLPEVVAGAGPLVDAEDGSALADAMQRMLEDDEHARRYAERGLARAREFSWSESAAELRRAYVGAIARRRAG
jgi:glycosyltransferase involved in cell wall biosynthesis